MAEKTKNKNNGGLGIKLFLGAAIFGLLLFNLENFKAQGSDCDLLSGVDKEKCIELEKKARAYRDIIELKNKQQNTLNNQLKLIDTEQQRNQEEFLKTQKKVLSLASQIENLNKEIQEKEKLVRYYKSMLSGLMQAYYEYDQGGVLNIVLANKNFSTIVNQADYIEQSSLKAGDILRSIRQAKSELEKEQDELEQKKEEHEKLKSDLEERSDELEQSEDQKQSLLTKTKGEENRYQELLARVEAQKLELFNFSAAGNLDEVAASIANYPKPDKKYWASTSWYYSQKDPRWGNKTIGNSSSLMKDYGCAVTSLSMVFSKYGVSIDPGKMAKQEIFYYDLIKWPGLWSSGIILTSSTAHAGVNWTKVDSEIASGHPVIVYIKRYAGGGHYVVIHNKDKKDYVVHDPYFGPNLYLETSKALVGQLGKKSGTTVDQMIIYN